MQTFLGGFSAPPLYSTMDDSVVIVLSDSEEDDIQIIKTTPGTGLSHYPNPRPVVPLQLLCNTGSFLQPPGGIKAEPYVLKQYSFNTVLQQSQNIKKESNYSSRRSREPASLNNNPSEKQEVFYVENSPLVESKKLTLAPSTNSRPITAQLFPSHHGITVKQETNTSTDDQNQTSGQTPTSVPSVGPLPTVPSVAESTVPLSYHKDVAIKEKPKHACPEKTNMVSILPKHLTAKNSNQRSLYHNGTPLPKQEQNNAVSQSNPTLEKQFQEQSIQVSRPAQIQKNVNPIVLRTELYNVERNQGMFYSEPQQREMQNRFYQNKDSLAVTPSIPVSQSNFQQDAVTSQQRITANQNQGVFYSEAQRRELQNRFNQNTEGLTVTPSIPVSQTNFQQDAVISQQQQCTANQNQSMFYLEPQQREMQNRFSQNTEGLTVTPSIPVSQTNFQQDAVTSQQQLSTAGNPVFPSNHSFSAHFASNPERNPSLDHSQRNPNNFSRKPDLHLKESGQYLNMTSCANNAVPTQLNEGITVKKEPTMEINSQVPKNDLSKSGSKGNNPFPSQLNKNFSVKKEKNVETNQQSGEKLKHAPCALSESGSQPDVNNPFTAQSERCMSVKKEPSVETTDQAGANFAVSKTVARSGVLNQFPAQAATVKKEPGIDNNTMAQNMPVQPTRQDTASNGDSQVSKPLDLGQVKVKQEPNCDETEGSAAANTDLFNKAPHILQSLPLTQNLSSQSIGVFSTESVMPTLIKIQPTTEERSLTNRNIHAVKEERQNFYLTKDSPNLTEASQTPVYNAAAETRKQPSQFLNQAAENSSQSSSKKECEKPSGHQQVTNSTEAEKEGQQTLEKTNMPQRQQKHLPLERVSSKENLMSSNDNQTTDIPVKVKTESSISNASIDTVKRTGTIREYFKNSSAQNCSLNQKAKESEPSDQEHPITGVCASSPPNTDIDSFSEESEDGNYNSEENQFKKKWLCSRCNSVFFKLGKFKEHQSCCDKTESNKVSEKRRELNISNETKVQQANEKSNEIHYFEVDNSFYCCYCEFKSHHEKTVLTHCEIVHKVSVNESEDRIRMEPDKSCAELSDESSSSDEEKVENTEQEQPQKVVREPGERTLAKVCTMPFVKLLDRKVTESNPHGRQLLLCASCSYETVLVGKMFLHLAGKGHQVKISGLKDEGRFLLCMPCALRTTSANIFKEHLFTAEHKVLLRKWKAAGYDKKFDEHVDSQDQVQSPEDQKERSQKEKSSNILNKSSTTSTGVKNQKVKNLTDHSSKSVKSGYPKSDNVSEKNDLSATDKPLGKHSDLETVKSDNNTGHRSSKCPEECEASNSSLKGKHHKSSKNCSEEKSGKTKYDICGSTHPNLPQKRSSQSSTEKSSKNLLESKVCESSKQKEDSHHKSSKHYKSSKPSKSSEAYQKDTSIERSNTECTNVSGQNSKQPQAAKSLSLNKHHRKQSSKERSEYKSDNSSKGYDSKMYSRSSEGKGLQSSRDGKSSSGQSQSKSSKDKDKNHNKSSKNFSECKSGKEGKRSSEHKSCNDSSSKDRHDKESKHSKKSSRKDHGSKPHCSSRKGEELLVKTKNTDESKTASISKGEHKNPNRSSGKGSEEKISQSSEGILGNVKSDPKKHHSSKDKSSQHKHHRRSDKSSKSSKKIDIPSADTNSPHGKTCSDLTDKKHNELKDFEDNPSRKRSKSDEPSRRITKVCRVSASMKSGASSIVPLDKNSMSLKEKEPEGISRKRSKSDDSSIERNVKHQRTNDYDNPIKEELVSPKAVTLNKGKVVELISNISDFSEKPYACALCFQRSKDLQDLKNHVQNHLSGGDNIEETESTQVTKMKSISKESCQPISVKKATINNPKISVPCGLSENRPLSLASYQHNPGNNLHYINPETRKQTQRFCVNPQPLNPQTPYREQTSVLPVHNQIIQYTSHISQFATPQFLTVSTGTVPVMAPNQTSCFPHQLTHVLPSPMPHGKQQFIPQQPQRFVPQFQQNPSQYVAHQSQQFMQPQQQPEKCISQKLHQFVPTPQPQQFVTQQLVPSQQQYMSSQQQFVPQNPQQFVPQNPQQFVPQNPQRYVPSQHFVPNQDQLNQQYLRKQHQQFLLPKPQQLLQQYQQYTTNPTQLTSNKFKIEDIIDVGIDFVKDPQKPEPFLCLYCNQRAHNLRGIVRHFESIHPNIVQAKVTQAQMKSRAAAAAHGNSVKPEKSGFSVKPEPMECS